jgi:acyl-CoA-binding protein
MTSGDSTNTGNDNNNLVGAFREKVKLMQTWKPGSTPSNRDRLELYAYHKVAVSGDAPSSLSNSANAAERAKYQAWRSKSGKSQEDSMRLYLQEADRQ